MYKQRRAIGAQNLIVFTHVEKDMWVIKGGPGTHTLQFLDAYENFFNALVVCKMWCSVFSHLQVLSFNLLHFRQHYLPNRIGRLQEQGPTPRAFRQDQEMTMDMQSFSSDGVQIAYIDEGDKAWVPVLLIHGFASHTEANWIAPGWVPFLVEAGYRIISIDNRGHGQSEKLYDLDQCGAPLMAEDAGDCLIIWALGRAM